MINGWELVNLDGKGFEIKLNFKEPLKVSSGTEPDLLLVQIQLSKFPNSNGQRMPPSIIKYIEIPMQMSSQQDAEAIEDGGGVVYDFLVAALASNFVVNMIFGGPLEELWGLLESLQIAQVIKLFDARVPGNVMTFTDFFEELTSGKIADTFIEETFYVPDQDPYSLNF